MGLLISIEGADYVGKTSLAVPGLEAVFSNCGIPVLTSREPGGSPEAETIRTQIFSLVKEDASQMELAKLFNKARRIHLEQVIIPFLGSKKENKGIVILDRYLDSTRVYQGMEGKLPLDKIYALEDEFVDGFLPDITYVLYFPEDHIKQYIEVRKKLSEDEKTNEHINRAHTIWDEATLDEYKKRQEYHFKLQEIARERGEQREFVYIDASMSPYEIVKQLAENTARYMMKHNQIELPQGFEISLSKSLAKVKTSLFMLFADRQWKKQQVMLKKLADV